MPTQKAVPAFSGKHNAPSYYDAVDSILRVLRPASTLRVIADHLNAQDFLTPSGLPFNRARVANYLRRKSI